MSRHQLTGAAPRAILGPIQANARGRPPAIIIGSQMQERFGLNGDGTLQRPRAEDPPAPGTGGFLKKLGEDFEGFKAAHKKEVDGLKAQVDGLQEHLDKEAATEAAMRLTSGQSYNPQDKQYTGLFTSYLRSGGQESGELRQAQAGQRADVMAAMTESNPASGGYVAPVEWDRKIIQNQRIFSPMRRIANVQTTAKAGYSTLWSDGAWGSAWVGETAARPQTTTPTLTPLTFTPGEIFAYPMVTQNLLNDGEFDIAGYVQNEAAETFALNEGVAFIGGDGVNKPVGLLTYAPGQANASLHPGGPLSVFPSGAAAAITPDALVDFVYSLPSVYRTNATWLMNSTTAATISKLKDGQGNYLWNKALTAGQPSTLLGYPVETDENMPDVSAGSTPVAFGDFRRGYVVNDRAGIGLLKDPYTNKPFVGFYMTKRVGGGVTNPRAIRLLKIAAS